MQDVEQSGLTSDRVAAGLIALDIPLKRLEGGTATLREHLGNPLIVLVWSTWDMCRASLPVWQVEWPGLRTPGARFVAVAADADFAAAKTFALPFDFTTLIDTENRLAPSLGYRVAPNAYL